MGKIIFPKRAYIFTLFNLVSFVQKLRILFTVLQGTLIAEVFNSRVIFPNGYVYIYRLYFANM